jgi:K+-sensing histidine kinase KdpD
MATTQANPALGRDDPQTLLLSSVRHDLEDIYQAVHGKLDEYLDTASPLALEDAANLLREVADKLSALRTLATPSP